MGIIVEFGVSGVAGGKRRSKIAKIVRDDIPDIRGKMPGIADDGRCDSRGAALDYAATLRDRRPTTDDGGMNGDGGGGGGGGGATFHLGTAVGGPAGAAGKFFSMAPPMGTACSSEGSHDSHNDSGYCTRPGGGSISGGPSPSLSGNTRKFVI